MSQPNMDQYKDMVKNTITARSAGEDALYDVMQGNIAVNGHDSVNAANRKRYSSRANSTVWQQHIASDSTATVLRQQAYMMAEMEKELSQLIDLQRKQYALSAINEMQMANLVMQMKDQSISGKMQAADAQQSAIPQGANS
jgi:ABC-type transporter Mla maintaining outer membrane lipid asymmetry ATPase subunit MlaF